jgi:hypothetical protein
VLIGVSGRAGTLNLHPDRLLVGLQTLRKGPKRRRHMQAFGSFFSRASIVRQQARRQSRSQRGRDEEFRLRLSTFGPRLAQTEGTGLRGAAEGAVWWANAAALRHGVRRGRSGAHTGTDGRPAVQRRRRAFRGVQPSGTPAKAAGCGRRAFLGWVVEGK